MSASASKQRDSSMKGWLHKWTNYLKGYQKRYFVLSTGMLSYFRSPGEMSHTCRGTIKLAGALITTGSDSYTFTISSRGTHTFHLKASAEIERQKWVTALELAKSRAVRAEESSDEEKVTSSETQHEDMENVLRLLGDKLEDVNTCNDLISKHSSALQRSLVEIESSDGIRHQSTLHSHAVNERATLFRITCTAMVNAANEYAKTVREQAKRWQRLSSLERERCAELEKMLEQLALQHSALEEEVQNERANAAIRHPSPRKSSVPAVSEDEEFFDATECLSDSRYEEEFEVALPMWHKGEDRRGMHSSSQTSSSAPELIGGDESDDDEDAGRTAIRHGATRASVIVRREVHRDTRLSNSTAIASPPIRRVKSPPKLRRSTIPARPNHSLGLWTVLKHCIGRDLSRISMPVHFNEPLSMLQRLTEDLEYSDLLDKAAACDDTLHELAYVAAFMVSSYAVTTVRTAKPFNPLLGETFECDRYDDRGWRSISEQVSHHPPIAALHVESDEWTFWAECCVSSKFRGKYMQVTPQGMTHLVFRRSQSHYTWRRVTTTVHNIVVGKLWLDHSGETEIFNHGSGFGGGAGDTSNRVLHRGERCSIRFIPYSYFNKSAQRKVYGVVTNAVGEPKYVLSGTWDESIAISSVSGCPKIDPKTGKNTLETEKTETVWKREYPPADYERMHNFTQFAIELNEPDSSVAPTDSRRRSDQRQFENGDWDEATRVKQLLEERQRQTRRERDVEAERVTRNGQSYPTYQPTFFRQETDPFSGEQMYVYKGGYWEEKAKGSWEQSPAIFDLP